MLYGDLLQGGISYYLGGFNGTGEDTSDNNGDKDLAFRLAFVPFRSSESFWLKGLHLAGDVTWGNEDSLNSPQGQTGARTPIALPSSRRNPRVGIACATAATWLG